MIPIVAALIFNGVCMLFLTSVLIDIRKELTSMNVWINGIYNRVVEICENWRNQ